MSKIKPEAVEIHLETWLNLGALYTETDLDFTRAIQRLPGMPERILRRCEVCDAEPTWELASAAPECAAGAIRLAEGTYLVSYRCTLCEKSRLTVWYRRSGRPPTAPTEGKMVIGVLLTKLGQWPPPETRPDPTVEKALSVAGKDFYKKGLRSLAHGFGVGALAYFRRVVEDSTKEILSLIETAAEAEGDPATAQRVREAMAARNMEEKLRLAAEALPPSLRPGDANPLRVLFVQYSKGLHDRTEQECSQIAERMRFTLEYLFKNWKAQLEESERFRKEVEVWSDPKAEPGAE